jgi:hypothetical protein
LDDRTPEYILRIAITFSIPVKRGTNLPKIKKQNLNMKKRLLFALSVLFVSALSAHALSSQPQPNGSAFVAGTDPLELQDENGMNINDATIRVASNDLNAYQIQAHIWLKNNTASDLTNIHVKRTINKEVDSTANSICFGVLCYPPWIGTSSDPYTINAGTLDKSFYGDYQASKKAGLTSITYEFYDSLSLATPVYAKTTVEFLVVGSDLLELQDDLGNRINDGILKVNSSDVNVYQMQAHIWIKNQSFVNLDYIYVKRTVNQEVTGSNNSVCFGVLCYPPWVGTSIDPYLVAADALDKSFYGDYQPVKTSGVTSITYEFYDSLTLTFPVYAKTTVEYHLSGVGIDENNRVFKGPYPNPASKTTVFEYNLPSSAASAHLVIRDMLGVEVENILIDNRLGKKGIDVSRYASGIYFYSFIVDGKVIHSKKLIVKH